MRLAASLFLLLALLSPTPEVRAQSDGAPVAAEGLRLPEENRKGQAALVQEGERPRIGDIVVYHVAIVLPEGWSLEVPADLDTVVGLRAVKEGVSVSRKPREDGSQTVDVTVPYRLLRAGVIRIPQLSFQATHVSGGKDQVVAGAIVLETGTWLEEGEEPVPFGAEAPVPLLETDWLWVWLLGGASLLALGALLALLVARLRRRSLGELPQPPRPPEEVALERLDLLEKEDWLSQGAFDRFYTALSECLREYLGGRYRFDSMDMTTTELLRRLKRAQLTTATFEMLEPLMLEFDLVKFARKLPTATQAAQALEETRRFVKESTPVVAIQEGRE